MLSICDVCFIILFLYQFPYVFFFQFELQKEKEPLDEKRKKVTVLKNYVSFMSLHLSLPLYERQCLPCVVCLDGKKTHLLVPCGHLCLCENCSNQLNDGKCPICRRQYEKIIQCYL